MSVAIKRFVADEFAPDLDPSELEDDYDLLDSGIVDSLGLLMLIAWIEEQFAIDLDVGEVDQDDFRSVNAICALIVRSVPSTTSR